jgi:hypothetical protein
MCDFYRVPPFWSTIARGVNAIVVGSFPVIVRARLKNPRGDRETNQRPKHASWPRKVLRTAGSLVVFVLAIGAYKWFRMPTELFADAAPSKAKTAVLISDGPWNTRTLSVQQLKNVKEKLGLLGFATGRKLSKHDVVGRTAAVSMTTSDEVFDPESWGRVELEVFDPRDKDWLLPLTANHVVDHSTLRRRFSDLSSRTNCISLIAHGQYSIDDQPRRFGLDFPQQLTGRDGKLVDVPNWNIDTLVLVLSLANETLIEDIESVEWWAKQTLLRKQHLAMIAEIAELDRVLSPTGAFELGGCNIGATNDGHEMARVFATLLSRRTIVVYDPEVMWVIFWGPISRGPSTIPSNAMPAGPGLPSVVVRKFQSL